MGLGAVRMVVLVEVVEVEFSLGEGSMIFSGVSTDTTISVISFAQYSFSVRERLQPCTWFLVFLMMESNCFLGFVSRKVRLSIL